MPSLINRMFRFLIDDARDVAIILLDKRGVILSWNSGAVNLYGHDESEIIGKSYKILFSEIEIREGGPETLLANALLTRGLTLDGWRKRNNGTLFRAKISIIPIFSKNNSHIGFGKIIFNETNNFLEFSKIQYQAYHDQLTGIFNRTAFFLKTNEFLSAGNDVTILYLDLDLFKPINDSYGHEAGDYVLIEVANRLRKVVAQEGLLARIGGDEFAISILRNSNNMYAISLASEIIEALNPVFEFGGFSFSLGVSIGIANSSRNVRNLDAILRFADQALYSAKEIRGNAYCVYESLPSSRDNIS